MDKEQLFETFMLFQNFININNNIQNETKRHINDELERQLTTKYTMNKSPKQEEKIEFVQPKNIRNYDDRPIKSTNSNFIELLEKTLANEKEEDIIRNPPKKKIIKQEYKKKQINISKPSKNDKKYTYYTDFLDENGFLNEEKYNKLRGRSYNKNNYIRNCKNDDLNKEKVFKTENYENELNKNERKNSDIKDNNFNSEKN